MTSFSVLRNTSFIALGLAGALLALSCAQSDRIEVTYYYLPG